MRNLIAIGIVILLSACSQQNSTYEKAAEVLRPYIMEQVAWAMEQEPQTITTVFCERSAGDIHDFYSEGDYWWPNPENSDGPYIRNDGMTNPENFVEHRLLMIRFSKIVGSLASAYLITGNEAYVEQAFKHIKAWFVDAETKMNPSLNYAQAIKGVVTGRGIGIIDTIHLIEVAQALLRMQDADCVHKEDLKAVKVWFSNYINWLMTHPYGISEMNTHNNHATCWVMQVAAFAKLTDNENVMEFCRLRYKNILLVEQMASDGSFPQELSRTKPYGYMLFNLDAMATICQILSTSDDNLWTYTRSDGLSIKKAVDYMFPFIKNKTQWHLQPDVMFWEEWPMAQPSLIFAAQAYLNNDYFKIWKNLKHASDVYEVVRNMPIRNPLIWL